MRRKNKRGKSKLTSKLWKIGILVLILLLIFDGYLLIDSKIFNVKNLDIKLDKVNCASEANIRQESGILGKNILLLKTEEIDKKLKNKFFCIKNVNLSRQSLGKVRLEVSGREAVAILALISSESTPSARLATLEAERATLENLASQSGSISGQEKIEGNFLVDKDGIIFSKTEKKDNLPVIYFWGSSLGVGKNIGEGLISNSLKILEKMKTFGVETKEAKIYLQDVLLIIPVTQKPVIIFSLTKDIDMQLASLQLILTQAKIDEQDMEFINLSFDKPVVKYIPRKGESSYYKWLAIK